MVVRTGLKIQIGIVNFWANEMKAYLTKDNYKGSSFERPDPLPMAGEIYKFTRVALTAGSVLYVPGDTLELLEMIDESPHGYRCSTGNWKVRSKTGTNVWSTIEYLISDGWIVK